MKHLRTKKLMVRGIEYEIREMKGTERFRCADIQASKEGYTGMAGFLLKRCVLQPGNFNSDDEPAQTCDKLVNEIIKLSDATVLAVEDAEKKSLEASSSESGSD